MVKEKERIYRNDLQTPERSKCDCKSASAQSAAKILTVFRPTGSNH
jgi:hypothetical protein